MKTEAAARRPVAVPCRPTPVTAEGGEQQRRDDNNVVMTAGTRTVIVINNIRTVRYIILYQ